MTSIGRMLQMCLDIQGWMPARHLVWIYEQAGHVPPGGAWLEVGTWRGRSLLAAGCGLANGCRLYGVDHYEGSHDDPAFSMLDRREGPTIYEEAKYNLRRLQGEPGVRLEAGILLTDSVSASGYFQEASLDAVWIDGAHDYASVMTDLRIWRSKVRTGGLFAGHDLDPMFPGVERALRDSGILYREAIPNIWRAA